MLVRHAMTPDPITVGPDDLCLDVLRAMRRKGFRHAPVVENGHLVGIVSERDLLSALPHLVDSFAGVEGEASLCAPVRSVMGRGPQTCAPTDPVDAVALRMLDARIGSLAVVANGALVGIVTTTDLLRSFTDHLHASGAEALTLIWTRGGIDDAPDLARLVSVSGVTLVAYFVTETSTGALAFLLRVRSDAGTRAKFVEACAEAGLLLMATRDAA